MLMLLILAKLRMAAISFDSIYLYLLLFFFGIFFIHYLVDRYSMVLADNVDGGDDLDLIVTTMNGNVFCFSTPVPYHPMKVIIYSS